jgi:hypothetical protein
MRKDLQRYHPVLKSIFNTHKNHRPLPYLIIRFRIVRTFLHRLTNKFVIMECYSKPFKLLVVELSDAINENPLHR